MKIETRPIGLFPNIFVDDDDDDNNRYEQSFSFIYKKKP